MRELIRPGLFWVARLGLFLAVVAWVTSLSWSCMLQVPGVRAELISHGLIFSHHPAFNARSLGVNPSEGEWIFNDWLFGYNVKFFQAYSPFSAHEPPYRWGIPGLTRAHSSGTQIIAVSHWLIVTTFATFYGVLKFVYRKRRTEGVGDE